ncbi:MAG: hypothetical protein RMJ17_01245 [Candidatus Aenigmarchaeota archaeon]|nr:hypothetical protein [Candidatus Aenigmarchaeota archaeon]MDW8149208.1 hypothetical protein [Candidatus Aenigmarchaeota archaeon]
MEYKNSMFKELYEIERKLYKELERIEREKKWDEFGPLLYLYENKIRDKLLKANYPYEKARKIAKEKVKMIKKEVIDEEPYSYKKIEKIIGIGCCGNYPSSPNDFLTVMSWRREDYEGEVEYGEYFEED